MAELLIGAFLSTSLQYLLDNIASPYAAEFFSKGNKEEFSERLFKLKLTFNSLRAVRFEVEKKIINNPDVELWLDNLLDAIDAAEDFFGDINYDALEPKKDESSKARRKASDELLSKRPFSSVDPERNTNMENILTRLEYLANQIQTLGIEKCIVVDARPSKAFPAKTSLPNEPEIYGREHDIDALMELVMSDDVGSLKICVIPILGMAGVGKTTLAQTLFNHEGIRQMFHLKAWVSNSDKFGAVHVTKTILQQVGRGDTSNYMDLNLLQVNLMKNLMGKRFLIVLDNVGEDIHEWWIEVMKPFHSGAEGSKIIATTRDERVADSIRTVDAYHLRELSNDQCWKVFEKYASNGGDSNIFSQNPMLVSISEIAQKCNGLPYSAKVLGSLLKTLDVERWKEVLNNNIWKLSDERTRGFPAALEVSYYYLPSHLKLCFAYCSIFPKGYEFQKEEVVLLWMATNFVEQGDGDKRMEDIGGEYFDDLVSRSFFQLKTKTLTNTSYFVMHELINELARTVAGKYFCLLKGDVYSKLDKKTRHLGCVMQLLCRDDKISRYDIEASHLRTFLSFGKIYGHCISKEVVHNLLPKLKWLKVLSFRYCRMTELSESIGALKYLRYLDLSYTDIVMLPTSVVGLYNLQTLKLEDCCKLKALPDDMHHLINLRHLIISGCRLVKMPRKMRRLRNLQTLTNFVVGKDTGAAKVEELAELPNLQGELSIQMLENVGDISEARKEVKVLDKKKLEKIGLELSGDKKKVLENVGDISEARKHKVLDKKKLEKFGLERSGDEKKVSDKKKLEKFGLEWSGDEKKVLDKKKWVKFGLERSGDEKKVLENVGDISEARKEVKVLDKKKLEKLSLEWSVDYFFRPYTIGVLEMLSPHTTLTHLKILRYPGTDFPNWIGNDAFCNIVDVRLEDCGRCSKLPPFGRLPSLKNLHISGFDLVKEVGTEFYGNGYTKVPFPSLDTLSFNSMPSWRLWNSPCSTQTESEDATPYAKLKTLEISNCPNLTGKLPYSLPSLTELVITSLGCFSFASDYRGDSFVDMDLYPNLKTLSIQDCRYLKGLSQSYKGATSLSSIDIYDCLLFQWFPSGGLIAPKLSHLAVTSCKHLETLPEKMSSLSSLKTLEISDCPLRSLPEGGLPISLSKLEISYHQLLGMNWDWRTLPHLTCLSIYGYDVWEMRRYGIINDIESFPDEGLLPDTITSLEIKNFLELKSLDRNGLSQLTSLQTLELSNCRKLQTLSEEGFPISLRSLDTRYCPLLNQNYRPNRRGIYKIGGVSHVSIG